VKGIRGGYDPRNLLYIAWEEIVLEIQVCVDCKMTRSKTQQKKMRGGTRVMIGT
jgi:hypothetical protein